MADKPIKPPLTAAQKAKSARKALFTGNVGKSGLTQLMVFLNGLILTITAFVTLTVFINQMRGEDIHSVSVQVQKTLDDNLEGLSLSLEAVGKVLGMPDSAARNELASVIPNREQFERISWLEKTPTGWATHDLYASDTKPIDASVTNAVIANVRADIAMGILTGLNGDGLQLEGRAPTIATHSVVLVHPVLDNGKIRSVVFGITRLSAGLKNTGLLANDSVQRLIIRDGSTGARLLQLDRRMDEAPEKTSWLPMQTSNQSWSTPLGEGALDISVDIRENMRMAFISRVPFLLLLFGLTLTMIGTLYVRSNYRQSVRLSAMNAALSSKNFELKSQVDESNRLYETLQRSEREYRGVIDSVSDIIFETDATGNLLFVNATWEKITGFTIPHSLGRDLFDMLHPAEYDAQSHAFGNLVRGQGQAYRSITRLQTADGKFRAVELAFSMVRTDNMRNARVVGTITDVEERRRAEKALAEAEKKYRTIVENAAGGIYQVTAEGRILSANPALARMLGFEQPRNLVEAVPDMGKLYTDPRERLRYERDLETFGFVRNHETTIQRQDGQIIWVSENARAVKNDDGRMLYYEGSIEDVTQRKLAERALQEAKLQSDLANRAKSEFLANMSHELRTPLNAIIGFSEIIQNQAMGPVTQKAYVDYAGDINDSGKKLLVIINDILDISRIEAGGRTLNETLFSMHRTASTCVSLLGSKAEAGRVAIINNLHADMPKIIGEELAFKQIVMNILSNAIKFTPPDGRVTIDCDYAGPGSDLMVSITDTGIGMDEREIEKALSPFGQVESAFSRSNSGTGLGITLVDALIKMHDGRFELLSRKGVGTTATLVIPARRIAVPAKSDDSMFMGNVTPFSRPAS